jgi:hypothetical protein
MIGFIARAILSETGRQVAIEVLDDNTKAARRAGSSSPDAEVVTVILRGRHYSGTIERAALATAPTGSSAGEFNSSILVPVERASLQLPSPEGLGLWASSTSAPLPVVDLATAGVSADSSDRLSTQLQQSLMLHSSSGDSSSDDELTNCWLNTPISKPMPARRALRDPAVRPTRSATTINAYDSDDDSDFVEQRAPRQITTNNLLITLITLTTQITLRITLILVLIPYNE